MKTKEVKRGRPATLAPIIKSKLVHLTHKTPKEFVEMIFADAQKVMKNGVTDDPVIVKAQKTCLYQSVLKEQRKAIASGKKVAFKGRMVGNVKKVKWIHSAKPQATDAEIALVS